MPAITLLDTVAIAGRFFTMNDCKDARDRATHGAVAESTKETKKNKNFGPFVLIVLKSKGIVKIPLFPSFILSRT